MAKKREIIITCNAKQVQDTFDFLNKSLTDIKSKMQALNEKGAKDGWTEQMKKEFAELEKMATSINNFDLAPAEKAVRKFEDVLKNLAGSTLKDVKRALNEGKADLNKMAENDPNRQKLTDDLRKIAEQIKVISGTSMSLKEAKRQLNDLVNTPTDKLEQGLERLKAEYASLSGAQVNGPQGAILRSDIKNYEAQMALNKLGAIPTWNPATSGLNVDELKQQYAKLQQAYGAVANGPNYGLEATQIHKQMESITAEIKRQTDALKENERQQERNQQLATQGMETQKTLANVNTASYEQLERSLKFLEDRHKKLQGTETKRIQQSLANQAKLKARMKEMQQTMLSEQEISDRINNSKKYTVVQLQQAYDQLRNKLVNLRIDETDAIKATQKQMQALQREIEGATGKVSGLQKIWQTAVRNIGTYMGVFAAAGFIKNKLSELVKKNYELSDAIMNVRKVSQMTVSDINDLYANISKIDTRNTVNTLMDLAYQGGKLGIGNYGVEGLSGFVKAAEQVQMALGEDLGEEALPALAKLTENMGLIKDLGVEQAMQKTASAMFTLSTTSVSTGQGIVDFSKRLMPVAKSAGVTTDQLLGLASATESSGLAAEVAATAFVKMFPSIYKNADALENYLGLQKGFIRESYDQGKAMDAMVAIFDKMKQMGNINKYPEIFKLLGSEGARMNTVMTAMANNVDMLRDHLSTSNIAFKEGTAVINEYLLQNNSAAGVLERANNIWEKAFVNPEGVDMVKELAQQWYNLSKELTESSTWMHAMQFNLKMIAGLVGILIKLLPTLIKALMFYGVAQTIRKIYIEFTMLNTAMTAAAGTAGKLSAFMKSNIWVLAGTAILFAASAILDMAAASSKAKKEAEAMGDALKQASDEGERASAKERAELKKLYDATQDQKKAIEERTKAALELKRKYPSYFSDLTTEQILAGKAAEAYQNLAQQILNAAKARAMEKKIEELQTENMNLEDDNKKREQWRKDNQKKYNEEKAKNDRAVNQQNRMEVSGADGVGSKMGYVHASNTGDKQLIGQYQANDQAIDNNSKKMDENTKTMERLSDAVSKIKPATTTSPNMPTFTPGSGGGDGDDKKGGGASAEYRNEQQKAKALIDNIKNYYQRQMNALNELANETNMSEGDLKTAMDRLQEHMNDALANARKAIGGEKNEWEQFKANMRQDLYEQADEEGYNFSENLLTYIMDNQLDELRQMILKLSKELNKQGNQLLDQILRKATEDEAKNIKKVTDQRKLLEQEMLEKNYTGKVDLNTMNTMEKLGIGGMTSGQIIQLQKWKSSGKSEDEEAAKQFFANREKAWYKAFANARKNIIEVINTDIEGKDGKEKLLTILFGADYQQVLKGKELESFLAMSSDQWKVFYQKLLDYNDQWIDAQKKAYDENKKRQDYLFSNRPDVLSIDTTTQQLSQLEQQRNLFGQDATFGRQMGMVDTISNDPELMRYDLLQARAEMYYNKMYELRQQDLISEQQLKDAREQMTQAQINMQQKLMEAIQSRTQTIQNAIQPITDFAENAGQKLGDMMFNMESQSMTWNQIWKNMLLAMGKSIIQMGQQYAIQKLQRSLFNKQVEADEEMHQALLTAIAIGGAIARTTGELQIENGALVAKKVIDGQEVTEEISLATILTALGISKGAAKTIGALGWLGIPLVAVISSLLMGLLTSALSTAGAESAGSSSSTAATPKTKLVSGMLTYDRGNVDKFAGRRKLYDDGETQVYGRRRYLGEDGKVYTATAEPAPKDGLVTHPIATTVQGQPALVAENGPEIVIGRETTKAIMMNEPELIKYLANYQQHGGSQGYSTARGLAAYDSGNVQSVATQPSDISHQTSDSAERQALINRLDRSDALMEQVLYYLQNPVAPEIAMYDTGGKKGLRSKMKEADRFMARYGG